MIAPPETKPLAPIVPALESLRRRFQGVGPGRPCDLDLDRDAVRLDLESCRDALEEIGRPELAEAAARIALLTEVWECLATEDPREARAVADFCARAVDQLAGLQPEAEPTGDWGWIVEESTTRWGEYIGLLDPGSVTPPCDPPEVEPVPEDESPAFDPRALLRMLTGAGTPDATDPSPPPDRSPGGGESGPEIPVPPPTNGRRPAQRAPEVPTPTPEHAAPGVSIPDRTDSAQPCRPSTPILSDLDPELRDAFLAEATDLFERIEALVLGLGQRHDQAESLHELGRCYHTLKGAAGSVGLSMLAAQVHALEERLDTCSGNASDALIEQLHGSLREIEGVLDALRRGGPATVPAPVEAPGAVVEGPRPEAPDGAEPTPEPDGAAAEGPLRVASGRIDDLMDLVSELITRRGVWAAQARTMKDLAMLAQSCRSRLTASLDRFHDIGLAREPSPTVLDPEADLPGLLRRLSEQAADLAVLADSARASALCLADHSDALDHLTVQLWETLQAIRITPVRGLFQRLARVAHDAARIEGRQVEVAMIGAESGLDRAVQDKAFEPLLHVVRNAVGHGIEPPSERVQAGKPPAGRVTLEARREGNTLVLSVTDDGRGLDYAAIAAKARRLGWIAAGESPSTDRLNALIFEPGFSTRDQANAISGRGVGMDVVSQEVARLHGTLDLSSEPGRGTRLTLRLPIRLALERAMLVRVDGQAFALPIDLVEHAQSFEPDDQEGHGRAATVRVRDRRVPLLDTRAALGFAAAPAASCPKLLLVRAEGDTLALRVDAIEGTRELVFKPLGPLLAGHPVISGTSLSVTGEVILALKPSGLARRLRDGNDTSTPDPARTEAARPAPILVVDDSISVRRVATRYLRALGFEVEEVSHGLEALKKLRSQAYGLVLTDLEMPQMDGFELLAELGRMKVVPALPVVVTSAESDPGTRRRVLELGARAFVSKPVALEELSRVVETFFKHPIGAGTAPGRDGTEGQQPGNFNPSGTTGDRHGESADSGDRR